MARNPYLVGLLSGAGLLLVGAFMLYLVINEMTDYTTYDTAGVAVLQGWIFVLICLAGVAVIGSAVIAGVAWSLGSGGPAGSGAPLGHSRESSGVGRGSSPTARL